MPEQHLLATPSKAWPLLHSYTSYTVVAHSVDKASVEILETGSYCKCARAHFVVIERCQL